MLFQNNNKKKKLEKKGKKNHSKSRCLFVPPAELVVFTRDPRGIRQRTAGCREPLAGCGWQLPGLCAPFGCWHVRSKPASLLPCQALVLLASRAVSSTSQPGSAGWGHLPCGSWFRVGLGFLLAVGSLRGVGAGTQPGTHLWGHWCWASWGTCQRSLDIPGKVVLGWDLSQHSCAARSRLARSYGPFNSRVSKLFCKG